MLQDLTRSELSDVVGDLGHRLREDVGLVGDVHVELDVVTVLLRYFGVHFDVVLLGVFRAASVRVQQVLLRLEVLVDLAVYFDVLEAAVENDQDFSVDGPVVQVRDVALEHELERGQG